MQTKTPDEMLSIMIAAYEAEYYAQTGIRKTLKPADRERIELISTLPMFLQLKEMINYKSAMNRLDEAEGEYLDGLGQLVGVTRLQPQKARTTIRFDLSMPAPELMLIPEGTRVTAGDNFYFAVTEDLLIRVGVESFEATVEAMTAGQAGNNYVVGQINTLVDPLPYVQEITNIEDSQGGTDLETDERYRERIKLKPSSYSVAGPAAAYEYFTKSYSQAIADCKIQSLQPGVVDIRLLLQDGQLPNDTFLEGLKDYLEDKRPLTDKVVIDTPDIREYSVEMTYYIDKGRQSEMEAIKASVQAAVRAYTTKQASLIGQDIVPDELTKACLDAGAKRVIITQPTFTRLNAIAVAKCTRIKADFGGVE